MMALRHRLEDADYGVHEQIDAMLDSPDSMIILIDGRRAINYVRGFGLSACQLELLATDIERLVRTVTRAKESSCLTEERQPQPRLPGNWPLYRRA